MNTKKEQQQGKKSSEIKKRQDAKVQDAIKILEALPKEKQEVVVGSFIERSISFSGPLPHPGMLKAYDNVISGLADRIVVMAEKQSNHRIKAESSLVSSEVANSKRGQWLAWSLGMTTIIGGFFLISFNKDGYGFASIAGGLGSLVGTFIYGTNSARKEREENKRNAEK